MEFSIASDPFYINLFGQRINIGQGVLIGWGVCGIIIILSIIVRLCVHRFKDQPGKLQNVVELIVERTENYAQAKVPHGAKELSPYLITVGAYIGMCCVGELIGFRPPLAELAGAAAMGLFTFFWINFVAFKYRGVRGRLRYYVTPYKALAPIKVLTDVAVPISMSCRLFGNIIAGVIVMELIYAVVPLVVPAALAVYFSLFHSVIQAYIFITLTLAYTNEALE